MKNYKRSKFLKGIVGTLTTLSLAYTISLTPLYAQQIITDGNTNTTLNVNGKVTNVSTTTIKGENAFNSFSRFNVDAGNVVNLNVPATSSRLINVVHNEVTNINGILNSIKSGHIGGNIYLINPNGIVVGPQGVVNVGSLTALTPAKAFTDSFFTSPGNPDDASVTAVINGTVKANGNSTVNIQGKINAVNDINIQTGIINNSGEIYSGAVFQENNIAIGDVVNINTLASASNIAKNNGNIILNVNNDITNSGKIVADGGDNVNAGNITITSNWNSTYTATSLISAKGKGTNSNGGSINLNGALFLSLVPENTLDFRGGDVSGNGGMCNINLSSFIVPGGTIIKGTAKNGTAGNFNINADSITVNKNLYTDGTNLLFTSNDFTLEKDMIISSRDLNDPLTENHSSAYSKGNSGNINLNAPIINLLENSSIIAHADENYTSGNINIVASGGKLNLKDSCIKTYGDLTIISTNILNQGLVFWPKDISSGTFNSNFLTFNSPFKITSVKDIDFSNANIFAWYHSVYCPKVEISAPLGYLTTNIVNAKEVILSSSNITIPAGSVVQGDNLTLNATENFVLNGRVLVGGSVKIDKFSISANNIIDPKSNINPLIVGNNLIFHQTAGTQYQLALNGNLSGTGFIDLNTYSKNLNITNDSNYNIEIQNYTPSQTLQLLINGTEHTAGQTVDGIPIVQNTDIPFNDVTIFNNSTSNIIFSGPINIPNSDTLYFINNSGGNIIASNSNNLLTGYHYHFDAPNGYIGQNNKPINIDQKPRQEFFALNQGSLNAQAKGDIFLNSNTGAIQFDTIKSDTGDVNIIAKDTISSNSIPFIVPGIYKPISIEAKNINLTSKEGSIQDNSSNSPKNDLVVNVKGGQLYARAKGNILITNTGGDLHVKNVLSFGDLYLNNPDGSIIADHNSDPKDFYEGKDLMGTNIDIYSGGSFVGPNNSPVFLTTNNGIDKIVTNGDINFAEFNGNTLVDLISTQGKGDVRIKALQKLMDMTEGSDAPNIIGRNIYLDAEMMGGVDDLKYAPKIKLEGGSLTAFAYWFIHLYSYGDMKINAVSNAGRSDVSLTSFDGNIVDANPGELPNIYSNTIVLNAPNGTIGTLTDDLNIYSNYVNSTNGFFSATAKGLINVSQNKANLYVNQVQSLTGDVKLFSDASILDASADELPNIIGKNINFNTVFSGSLGLYGDDLDIQLKGGSISAQAFGYINLHQTTGDMNIDLVSNAGRFDVKLKSEGSIKGTTPGGLPSIYSKGLFLDATTTGTIGDGSRFLVVDTNYNNWGGDVTAFANGIIQLSEFYGDLNLGVASNAGRGSVFLAADGNILNAYEDNTINIYGRHILLASNRGSIGTFSSSINTYLNYNTTGGFFSGISNYGPVIINEKFNLPIKTLYSPFGAKYLKCGGKITYQ